MFRWVRLKFSEVGVGKMFRYRFAGQEEASTLRKMSGHTARVMRGPFFPLNIEFTPGILVTANRYVGWRKNDK